MQPVSSPSTFNFSQGTANRIIIEKVMSVHRAHAVVESLPLRLFESFWLSFQALYQALAALRVLHYILSVKACSLLSSQYQKAYLIYMEKSAVWTKAAKGKQKNSAPKTNTAIPATTATSGSPNPNRPLAMTLCTCQSLSYFLIWSCKIGGGISNSLLS